MVSTFTGRTDALAGDVVKGMKTLTAILRFIEQGVQMSYRLYYAVHMDGMHDIGSKGYKGPLGPSLSSEIQSLSESSLVSHAISAD